MIIITSLFPLHARTQQNIRSPARFEQKNEEKSPREQLDVDGKVNKSTLELPCETVAHADYDCRHFD